MDHFPGKPSILLATNHLYGWTGSETLILTLIDGLHRHGCKLTVYVRHLDHSWATSLCDRNIVITDNLDSLITHNFDLAHVQHNTCLMDIRAAFPKLPIVFSSLGVSPFLEQPAPFDCGISQYLAISEEVRENLIAQGAPSEKVKIVRNLVNELQFTSIRPIRSQPKNILVISNKMDESRVMVLKAAANIMGANIRFIGGISSTKPQNQLAIEINTADIVVSLGRGVVEAMLCGRVPLVYDINGGDGSVTPDNINELRTCNFSGRLYRKNYTVSALVAELEKYRQGLGPRLREIAKEQFGLSSNLPDLLDIYFKATNTHRDSDPISQEAITFCSNQAREELVYTRNFQSRAIQLENELNRVKSTASWHVTKPLRLVAFLWRKLQ